MRFKVLLVMSLLAQVAPAVGRPNVVLIMTDDQGYGDFGVMGNRVIETPHIDALATKSVEFTTFYVSPVCSPTRASVMTGRYNYRTRVVDTYMGRSMMEPAEYTLAEALRNGGYTTGLFGKWHLGDNYPLRPQDQGFDEVLMHLGGGLAQPADPSENNRRYTNPVLFHNGQQVQTTGYCTDVYFDHAIDFIDEAVGADQPFFAYVATNAPHGPFHDVPPELLEHYRKKDLASLLVGDVKQDKLAEEVDKLARIAAMITNIDQNVGRLLEHLRGNDQLDNTLILFLVDNGPNTRRYVGPFRGMKTDVHEGGVRSPLWMHWPSGLGKPRKIATLAAHIDIMPTLIDLCGVEDVDTALMDGRSLTPLLEADSQSAIDWPERTITIQTHRGDEPKSFHHFMTRDSRWKLLHASGFNGNDFGNSPQFELYDLTHDPDESNNLAAEHPQIVERLSKAYQEWFQSVSTTRPDNYSPPRIVIGAQEENPVVLSRQDWRGAKGWGSWHQGYWLIDVEQAGKYDIRVIRQVLEADQTLNLKAGSATAQAFAPAGQKQVLLKGVLLPSGPTRLEVELSGTEEGRGAYQVILDYQRH